MFALKLAVAVICGIIAALGVTYFWEGVAFAIDMMPTPWQCDLPGPPASCYGSRQVGDIFGLALYVLAVIVIPGGICLGMIVSVLMPKQGRDPRGPR